MSHRLRACVLMGFLVALVRSVGGTVRGVAFRETLQSHSPRAQRVAQASTLAPSGTECVLSTVCLWFAVMLCWL